MAGQPPLEGGASDGVGGMSRPGTVVIVGTGQGGFQTAASLREGGFDGRVVLVGDEPELPYQHLVLATGAHNRALPVPGGGLDGVFQLRSLAEAEALRRRLDGARRAVVVGAGFIGLEFAAVAAERGLEVTVVEAADRVMARAVSPPISEYFRAAHERGGVRFVLGAAVVGILGDGRVTGVATADGR